MNYLMYAAHLTKHRHQLTHAGVNDCSVLPQEANGSEPEEQRATGNRSGLHAKERLFISFSPLT